MIVPSALAVDEVSDNKFTIASCKTLCIPKNKNMANDRRIICCVGGRVSRKAEPNPASDLLDDFLVSSTMVTDGEFLMRGCLITVSSYDDEEPNSISRSSSMRGDIFLHIVANVWRVRSSERVNELDKLVGEAHDEVSH